MQICCVQPQGYIIFGELETLLLHSVTTLKYCITLRLLKETLRHFQSQPRS
jgi:hypothetical protein